MKLKQDGGIHVVNALTRLKAIKMAYVVHCAQVGFMSNVEVCR